MKVNVEELVFSPGDNEVYKREELEELILERFKSQSWGKQLVQEMFMWF